jgi:hypothetical protein
MLTRICNILINLILLAFIYFLNIFLGYIFHVFKIPDKIAGYLNILILLVIGLLLKNKYRAISSIIIVYVIVALFFSLIARS